MDHACMQAFSLGIHMDELDVDHFELHCNVWPLLFPNTRIPKAFFENSYELLVCFTGRLLRIDVT